MATINDPQVSSFYEVLSSFFVDTYFNHIYNGVRGKVRSRTALLDEYRRQISAFCMGVQSEDKYYASIVNQLHKYFREFTKYRAITFLDFLDLIIAASIPIKFVGSLTEGNKREIFNNIVLDLITSMGAYVISASIIEAIVIERKNAETTIRMLQDEGVRILFTKRSALHNQFMRPRGQSAPVASAESIAALKETIRELVEEKHRLLERNRGLEAALQECRSKLTAVPQRVKTPPQVKAIFNTTAQQRPPSPPSPPRMKTPPQVEATFNAIAQQRSPSPPSPKNMLPIVVSSPSPEPAPIIDSPIPKKSSKINAQMMSLIDGDGDE